jgi:hypothetical protein
MIAVIRLVGNIMQSKLPSPHACKNRTAYLQAALPVANENQNIA